MSSRHFVDEKGMNPRGRVPPVVEVSWSQMFENEKQYANSKTKD